MAEKPIKLKLFTSQHEIYMQTLMSLREKIGWIAEMELVDQAFVLPYVLTCAAALECALNDYIIKHFEGMKKSRDVVSGYLSMNLKGKLVNIVPLLTNGKYDINLEHKSYRSLDELVRIRNSLVHNNSTYLECDAVVVTDDDGKVLIKVPTEVHNSVGDYTFGIVPPLGRFHDGLEDMYEKFFYKYDEDNFSGNDLVIESA